MPSEAIYQDDYVYLMRGARDRAVNVLRGPWSRFVRFTFAGVSVEQGDFKDVATALEQNRIKVEVNYNSWSGGEYVSTNQTVNGEAISGRLILGSGTALMMYSEQQAVLVHEAVHAAMDLKSKGSLTVLISECVAYIAQQMFHQVTTATYVQGDRKFDVAAICAGKYLEGGYPSDQTMKELAGALAADPDYGVKRLSAKANFNG